jgi:uncharacterized protein YjbI with pentapeptide repeats
MLLCYEFSRISDSVSNIIIIIVKKLYRFAKEYWVIVFAIALLAFGIILFNKYATDSFANHIFEIVGIIIIPLALMHERNEMKEQQKEMHQHQKIMKDQQDTMHKQLQILEKQEILNAWMILNTHTPGNGGKKEALEFLAQKGHNLDGIDLSSETHGGSVYLHSLNLSEEKIGRRVSLTGAKFNGANLNSANFSGADFDNAVFNKANLREAKFMNTKGQVKFHNVVIYMTDFGHSDLSVKFYNDTFDNSLNSNVNHRVVTFNNSRIFGSFTNVILTVTNFINTTLHLVKFTSVNLNGSTFNNTKLIDVSFYRVSLNGATFAGNDSDWYVTFIDSCLLGVEFNSNKFYKSEFHNSDLSDMKLHNTNVMDTYSTFENNYILWIEALPTAPSPWEFRFVMKDGTYQREPKNINDIKQGEYISQRPLDPPCLKTKYFIHPVRTSEPDPSQKTPIS